MGLRPPIIIERRPVRQMSLWDEPRLEGGTEELKNLWPTMLCLTRTPLPYPLGSDILVSQKGSVQHAFYDHRRRRDVIYRAEPTVNEWKDFWQECDACGVWTWKKEYTNLEILDGSMWSLELSDGVRSLEITGQNDRPRTFRRFVRAAYALAGSPEKD